LFRQIPNKNAVPFSQCRKQAKNDAKAAAVLNDADKAKNDAAAVVKKNENEKNAAKAANDAAANFA